MVLQIPPDIVLLRVRVLLVECGNELRQYLRGYVPSQPSQLALKLPAVRQRLLGQAASHAELVAEPGASARVIVQQVQQAVLQVMLVVSPLPCHGYLRQVLEPGLIVRRCLCSYFLSYFWPVRRDSLISS